MTRPTRISSAEAKIMGLPINPMKRVKTLTELSRAFDLNSVGFSPLGSFCLTRAELVRTAQASERYQELLGHISMAPTEAAPRGNIQ